MVAEMVLNFISPMPFLYDVQYNEFLYIDMKTVKAQVNTILFCMMVLFRVYHIQRAVIVS